MSDREQKPSNRDHNDDVDVVTPAGGDPKGKNRPADANREGNPTADSVDKSEVPEQEAPGKAPKRLADKSMKESMESIFEGEELSEEFMTKATTVFEAAVSEILADREAELQEQFDEKLKTGLAEGIDSLTERLDEYLDYVAEKWMEQNEVAVENGIKGEIAESLLNGLAELFVEHNVDLDDEKIDLVAEAQAEAEKLHAKLDEQVKANMALTEEIEKNSMKEIFAEETKGLADTQVDKMRDLIENVEFEDKDQYRTKVKTIRESWFDKKPTAKTDEEGDSETVQEETVDKSVDMINESISRLFKN